MMIVTTPTTPNKTKLNKDITVDYSTGFGFLLLGILGILDILDNLVILNLVLASIKSTTQREKYFRIYIPCK